jgi:hypothetical protein
MIAVQTLYQECQDLLKTFQGGYLSNDEFNRLVNQAQNYLFKTLLEDSSVDRYTNESLSPFRKEATISKSSGIYTTPTDFAEIREVAVEFILSSGETEYRPCYLITDLGLTLTSPIRTPTQKTFGYTKDVNFKIYPSSNVNMLLKYFSKPVQADRKVTYSGDDELYNPTGTVNLEWNETDKSMVLDMVLFYTGYTANMPDIANWIQARNSFIQSENQDYK